MKKIFLSICILALTVGCSNDQGSNLSEDDVKEFLSEYEKKYTQDGPVISSAFWIASNFISHDSQVIAADYSKRYTLDALESARTAASFDGLDLDPLDRRALNLIKNGFVMPPPLDEDLAGELSQIMTELEAMYGTGKHCFSEDDCYDLEAFESIIDNSRDPDELLKAWSGWRQISPPMKDKYLRMVEIGNQGSSDLGFSGLSDLWFSKYDMSNEEFSLLVDQVYEDMRPLYESLQCHVRAELNDYYGDEIVPIDKPIPAHLLGNMWAQSWSNISDIVYDFDDTSSIDLTQIILDRELSEVEMVEIAESFFLSLGFDPLTDTFWDRSLFVKPKDRDVVCHASAWDIDSQKQDLRIKMCIQKNEEDFITIHHELGHIFYYQAYADLPEVFQSGANDGFHEAVGDLLSLSITPSYLKDIDFISEEEAERSKENAIGLLMKQALEGVVAVPWTLMLDKWRMAVFDGNLSDDQLNDYWWELREKYQGVASPIERPVDAFDPEQNTIFLVIHLIQDIILQGYCSTSFMKHCVSQWGLMEIYMNALFMETRKGLRLRNMLAVGQSEPWPDALRKSLVSEHSVENHC